MAALAGVAPAGATAASCPDTELQPAPETLGRVEAAMACLINQERTAARLVPLRVDSRLGRSATFHVRSMIARRFFNHETPGHPTLLRRILGTGYFAGVRDGLFTQNLGYGPDPVGTADSLVEAWMASESHRRNILEPRFRHIGFGSGLVGPGAPFHPSRNSAVYATDFGRRLSSTARRRRLCRRATRRGSTAPTTRRFCRRTRRR
jgi:uncharacterized protein YkwD